MLTGSARTWVTAATGEKPVEKFLPSLKTILELKRDEARYLGYRDSPYDALLDTYEPGATVAQLAHCSPNFVRVLSRSFSVSRQAR